MTALEWVTAASGIAAAVVPAALFLFERRDRKAAENRADEAEQREREALEQREREGREREARMPAERFHVWAATRDEPGVMVLNAGPTPVTDINIEAMTYDGSGAPPQLLLYGLVVLPPTREQFFPLNDLLPFDDLDHHDKDWHVATLALRSVTFTDGNGVRWRRLYEGFARGPLEQVPGE